MRGTVTRLRRRLRAARQERERGSATVFVLGLTVVLLALAGLVIDGGTAINARQTVADDVEQASRAGATAVAAGAGVNGGVAAIDQAEGQQRARNYLLSLGYESAAITFPPDMPQNGNEISVSASKVVPTKVLQVIGKENFPVRAATTSRAAVGVITEVAP